MDPNVNLDRIRFALARIHSANDENREQDPHDGMYLAELVEALDTWLCRGGFLPAAWKHAK